MAFEGILGQSDLFYELTEAQLALVAAQCEQRTFAPGEVVFHENDPSKQLYIIAAGEIEILVEPSLVSGDIGAPTGPVTIATLRRGQNFGEVALVDQGLRSATARCALPNTRLLVIPRDKLMQLCDDDPALGYSIMRNLAADLAVKIRNTDLNIREQLLYGQRRFR